MSKRKRKSSRTRSTARRSSASGSSQPKGQSLQKAPVDLPDAPAGAADKEYRYVASDLKRVTILAATMFALLIALSFFIG
jgi:hypothetical protein